MKALTFLQVKSRNGNNRRRPISDFRVFSIPEKVTSAAGGTKTLITDSLAWSEVVGSYYSVPENAWRDLAGDMAAWRKYQTALNRSRRTVGIHGAVFGEVFEEPAPVASLPTGTIASFTDLGYLGMVENDLDTQNEWDEGDLPSKPTTTTSVAGVLVRLARNNAVYFIPQKHLDKYEVFKNMPAKKQKAEKALFGHAPKQAGTAAKRVRVSPSPRLIGVKNILSSIGDSTDMGGDDIDGVSPAYVAGATDTNPNLSGTITSFTEGRFWNLMEEIRDFDDDFGDVDGDQ
ncbi:hypothetical protein ABGN05_14095 [Aquibium sp. LZ166]|uniref:Capsid protein n=1 Tax=Aquibium pacificus TaxID=3153579 RepID=A0ABV3SKE5_9HYPH